MRTNLQVPFAEKDDAKKLGARWDPIRKVWFIENTTDIVPFMRWMPAHHMPDELSEPTKTKSATKTKTTEVSSLTIVGTEYVYHPRVCDCPPWDVCDKCKSTALGKYAPTK